MDWMLMPLRRYAEFTGRSRRKEFWMFVLLNVIVYIVLGIVVGILGGFGDLAAVDPNDTIGVYGAMFGGVGLLFAVWWLAVLLPTIAVSVRRLHDLGFSGWWYLAFIVGSMIPLVGILVSIAFLIVMALPGNDGPNRFGPDPKNPTSSAVFE